VKSGPKPAASPRKNGQRWLSAIPPQGGFLFIPASFFGFRLFFKTFLFISIAAVIARAQLCLGAESPQPLP
jgi:hypothetical protein